MGPRHRLALRPRALLELGLCGAPENLVASRAVERLARIDPSLPAVAQIGAFEVRLGDGPEGSVVDFELAIAASPTAFEKLRAHGSTPEAAQARDRSRAWADTLDFLSRWSDSKNPLSEEIRAIWIEFDAEDALGETKGEPSPFIIATLDRERFYPNGLADQPRLEETIVGALSAQGGEDVVRIRRRIHDFLDLLPPFAQVLHVARRPTTGGEVIRLVVVLPWERMASSLVGLGWEGPVDELEALLVDLPHATLAHSVNLDLDLAKGLASRIGIEFHYPSPPDTDPRWRALFDYLEKTDACNAERRAQIEAWGSDLAVSGELSRRGIHLRRELLVKVVYEPERPLRAKAYLPYHFEVDPSRLDRGDVKRSSLTSLRRST